jgi:hypothetical protein
MGEPAKPGHVEPDDDAAGRSAPPTAGVEPARAGVSGWAAAPTPGSRGADVGAGHRAPELFEEPLEDAEALVQYAASAGIEIEDDLRRFVVAARTKAENGWTDDDRSDLLAVLTKLSSKLKPVSGESARICKVQSEARKTIRTFELAAAILAVPILVFSYFSFVATSTCNLIRKDIDVANSLALALHSQLFAVVGAPGTPGAPAVDPGKRRPSDEELKNLQLFASTVRDIQMRTNKLRRYAWLSGDSKPVAKPPQEQGAAEKDRSPDEVYQLPVLVEDVVETTKEVIRRYQSVRTNAQRVQEDVSTGLGAATTYFLPVLYAVLGACAYLARRFEKQIETRTFSGTGKPMARFVIAAIGGLVVGLFGTFGAEQGTTLPPLAIAFLVGYGADVFFVFLDGLLQPFARSPASAGSESGARG